ncbi:hypothetical protein [Kosmotoga pacifica]|uniref:Uncharacterized protein n=1 Tax=Kosmotoga pacifica TaxID=1330330 RepID=A0A0G2ZAI4_9BACT|nr:hypothetical protein [Kosmotoga pacifica]AKI96589.1 hypothetical protein IX53_00745 [Kosmotoga pacifica]
MALPALEAKVKLNMKEFDSGLKKMQQSWKSLMDDMAKLGAAGGAAFAGMTYGLKKATEAWAVQETATKKLEIAINRFANADKNLLKQLKQTANELQNMTGVGNETLESISALGLSLGISGDKIKEATEAAVLLNQVVGMDLVSAMKNLAKTQAGLTGELGEALPFLRELTQEQLKQGQAIDLITERLGGYSELLQNTTGVQLARFNAALGDIAEVIGSLFTPEVKKIADLVSNFSNALANLSPESKNTIKSIIKLGMSFAGLLAIFGTLALTWKAVSFVVTTGISIITNPWTLLIGAIVAGAVVIISKWDEISAAWKALVSTWRKSSPESLTADWENFVKAIKEGDIKGIAISALKLTFDSIKWFLNEVELTKENIISILNADNSWTEMKEKVAETWKDGHYLAAGITAIVGFAIAAVKWVWEQTKEAFTATLAIAEAENSWEETKKQVSEQWQEGDYLAAGITATVGFVISAVKWLWDNIKGGVVTAAELISDANTTWDDIVKAVKEEWSEGNYLAAGIIATAAGIVEGFEWFWEELKTAITATKIIAEADNSWATTKKEVSKLWGEDHYLAAGITAVVGAVISGIKWVLDTTLDIANSLKEWYANSELKKKVDEFKKNFSEKPFGLDTVKAGLSVTLEFFTDITGGLAEGLKKTNEAISAVRERLRKATEEATKKSEKVDFFTIFSATIEEQDESIKQLAELGKNMAAIVGESFKISFNVLGLIKDAISYAITQLTGSETAGEVAGYIPLVFAATWAANTLTTFANSIVNALKGIGFMQGAAKGLAVGAWILGAALAFDVISKVANGEKSLSDAIKEVLTAAAVAAGIGIITKSGAAAGLAFSVALYIIPKLFEKDYEKQLADLNIANVGLTQALGKPAEDLGTYFALVKANSEQVYDSLKPLLKDFEKLSPEAQAYVQKTLEWYQNIQNLLKEFDAINSDMTLSEDIALAKLNQIAEKLKELKGLAVVTVDIVTGGLPPHQSGGYTAPVDPNQVAGVVHGGEWVAPAWLVKRYPGLIAMLEGIRQRGYKSGGYVVPGFGPKNESYSILDEDTTSMLDKTLNLLISAIDTLTPVIETMSDGMLSVVSMLENLVADNPQASNLLEVLKGQIESSKEGLSGLAAALEELKQQLRNSQTSDTSDTETPPEEKTWWDKLVGNLKLFASEVETTYKTFKENKFSDAIKAVIERISGTGESMSGVSMVMSALGTVVGGVVGYFDRMLGLSQAFMEGFLKPLQPVLEKLRRPFEILGELLGNVLVPILEVLVPIFEGIVKVFAGIYNFLFGWLFGKIDIEPKLNYEEEETGVVTKTYSAGVTGSVTNNITIQIDTYGLTDPEGIKKLWELLQGYAGDLELARG